MPFIILSDYPKELRFEDGSVAFIVVFSEAAVSFVTASSVKGMVPEVCSSDEKTDLFSELS